ncbi:MAG: aminotransferase class V-fold PLP-dependent enzyme [Pseudomonadota bacterium]
MGMRSTIDEPAAVATTADAGSEIEPAPADREDDRGVNLSHGPTLLALPGPTMIPDVVLQAMQRPACDIYGGGELEQTTHSILSDLKPLFRTVEARTYLYVANGHGGWEAAISNLFSAGDKVLVLASGRFAIGWGEMASAMGVEVEVLPSPPRGAVDPAAVEARLRADAGGAIKAVLTVQIDTASGVQNDLPSIRAALDAAGHGALFLVDGVASIGCTPFEMDAWGVDLALTGSQKGLMTPPGLAPMAAGPRALEAHASAGLRTRYWDWTFRDGPEHYQKYCGTPPTHLLFGLRRSLDLLLVEEGLEAAWARHRRLARSVRAAIDAWGQEGALECAVLKPEQRSDTVTPVFTAEGLEAEALRQLTAARCGVTLGLQIGDDAPRGRAFRIAHMGHVSAASVMGVLGATEAGMRALGWPIGEGGLSAAAAEMAAALGGHSAGDAASDRAACCD